MKENNNYDVIIIGGGIIGSNTAYELSKYNIKFALIEKNPFVGVETTSGNSGVIHGGFDAVEGTLKAKYNVLGNKLWINEIFNNLEFPRAKVDSIVLAFNEKEMEHTKLLYDRGISNGVSQEDMQILSKEEIIKKEPNVNKNILGGFLCTSSWAIEPQLATRAMIGAALNNGMNIFKNTEVLDIDYIENKFIVKTTNQIFKSQIVINAAGHSADIIAKLAGYDDFEQKTRRGQYRIVSSTEKNIVNNILFMMPTIHGKGVVVAPMLDNRVMVGPTAIEDVPKDETRVVTMEEHQKINDIGKKIIPNIKLEKTIKVFAGSRPIDIETDDFVIRSAKENQKFINLAGMQSPAIASSPAIAKRAIELINESGLILEKKSDFNPKYKIIW